MQENVKIVPSVATNFTAYAEPDIAVKLDGIKSVSVHVFWIGNVYQFGEGQLLCVMLDVAILTP
jgi:hypothetical protein